MTIWGSIKSGFDRAVHQGESALKSAGNKIAKGTEHLGNKIAKGTEQVGNKIAKGTEQVGNKIAAGGQTAINRTATGYSGLVGKTKSISRTVGADLDPMGLGIEQGFDEAKSLMEVPEYEDAVKGIWHNPQSWQSWVKLWSAVSAAKAMGERANSVKEFIDAMQEARGDPFKAIKILLDKDVSPEGTTLAEGEEAEYWSGYIAGFSGTEMVEHGEVKSLRKASTSHGGAAKTHSNLPSSKKTQRKIPDHITHERHSLLLLAKKQSAPANWWSSSMSTTSEVDTHGPGPSKKKHVHGSSFHKKD